MISNFSHWKRNQAECHVASVTENVMDKRLAVAQATSFFNGILQAKFFIILKNVSILIHVG